MVAACALPGTTGALAQDTAALCPPATGGEQAYTGVTFTGRTGYLDRATLDRISGSVAGCSIARTTPDLGARLVNAAYQAYPAPLAFARPAGRSGQTMIVELVEITYGAVNVTGNQTTRADYVRQRAGVVPGGLADVAQLESRLAAVPEVEDIRVDADLTPGAQVGTSDLTLAVTEPAKPYSLVTTLDNYGSDAQGQLQAGVSARWNSLTGRRDPLSLSATIAKSKTAIAVSYDTPINGVGTRLSFNASLDSGTVSAGLPATIGLRTETRSFGVTMRHPLRADEQRVDLLTGSLQRTKDKAVLSGFTLLQQDVTEVRLGMTHIRRWPGKAVLTVSHGIGFGKNRDAVAGTTETFRAYSGFASLVYKLSDTLTASTEIGWQATGDIMPSSLRFGVTGPSAARGFATNDGSANLGYYTRNQLNLTLQNQPDWGQVTPYAFLDAGEGWEIVGGTSRRQGLLASVGAGLGISFKNGAGLDLWVAKPVKTNAATTSRSAQIGVRFAWTF
ncbi:ShlB/FhaC/HecB family hemolysin secretion/activation protein [Pseudooceanicola sp. MF1-13]|uniref:ShlB/FhaC/HecB family hemolysin secretion/activation protein n=1 Tax=Pseudooceanicola sp. MF1-13 TaxID=3379095 RepID=UPI00389151E6